jgi:hypothetical protein
MKILTYLQTKLVAGAAIVNDAGSLGIDIISIIPIYGA